MNMKKNSIIALLLAFLVVPVKGQLTKNVWQECNKNGDVVLPSEGMHQGHNYVDLGLSVKWATVNVGAAKPEGIGNYYMWGHTYTTSDYKWETYKHCYYQSASKIYMKKYLIVEETGGWAVDNLSRLERKDDVAATSWGGNWRIPTPAEVQELIVYCDWKYTTLNGVKGYWITSRKEGYTQNGIFLPLTGCMLGTSCILPDMFGYIWTSELYGDGNQNAYGLRINYSGSYYLGSFPRYEGFPIRPVLDL